MSPWLRLFILLALTLSPVSAQAQDRLDYSIVLSGNMAGSMTVAATPDGGGEVRYSFNDRGRGPELVATHRLDARQWPVEVTVRGVDYFKVAVEESFRSAGESARWSSAAETGEGPARGFYIPYQGAPEHLAMLARAALAAGGTLDLLPVGRVAIRKVMDREVRNGETRIQTSLYAIEGLGFTPALLWLDSDRQLFFVGGSWSTTIRRGWEASAAELIRLQQEVETARETAQARELQRRPRGPVAIRDVRLFDPERRRLIDHSTVVVTGNRITAVGADGRVAVPAGAEIVEGRGRVVLPGMWDNHVHLGGSADGLLHLAAGVTTVRDMANDMDELGLRRRRIESGELIGPRILMAGFLDGPGPFAGPSRALVRTPEEVRSWIERYANAGYVQIKLYSSLNPELVPVAAAAAHARGLRLSGHIPAGMTMEQAVEAGYDEVQHANFWFLNFMGPEVNAHTNNMTRFYAVGERAGDMSLDTPEMARFIALLQRRHTVLDPTLVTFESLYLATPRHISPELAAVADRLPATVRRDASGGGLARDDAARAQYRRAFERMMQLARRMHDAGIVILPGTDAIAGIAYDRELELYAEAGIPAGDVLYMATLGSARVNRRDRELGSIEAGKLADLVLIDGDPLVRMSDVRRVDLVIRDGVVFEPARLHAALGIAPPPPR